MTHDQSRRNAEARIRKRVIIAIEDFTLLVHTLKPKDRDGIFGAVDGPAFVDGVLSFTYLGLKESGMDFESVLTPGEELVERFVDSPESMVDQPEFVRFGFFTPFEDGDIYIAQTYWEPEDDFEAWTESNQFQNAYDDRPSEEMFVDHPTLETTIHVFRHDERRGILDQLS